MKLATYQDGSRDGHLVVVSRDLSTAVYANTQATRLQQLLDDWNFVAPQLHDLYLTLNHGKSRHAFAFDPALCMAPVPRSGSWAWQALDGEAGDAAAAPRQPALQAGAGDDMRGPRGELDLPEGRRIAAVAAGVAVFTGDLAMGASPAQALEAIRLLGLYSRWTLAADTPGAGADAQLAPRWAPVLITPDEAGGAWSGGRLDLTLQLQWLARGGAKRHGSALTVPGRNQRWHHGQLLAWAARHRRVRAGAVVGCDWLSEPLPLADATLLDTEARAAADGVGIEIVGRDGLSLFDRIAPSFAPGPAEPRPAASAPGADRSAGSATTAQTGVDTNDDAGSDDAVATPSATRSATPVAPTADAPAQDAAGVVDSPAADTSAPAARRQRGATRKRTIGAGPPS